MANGACQLGEGWCWGSCVMRWVKGMGGSVTLVVGVLKNGRDHVFEFPVVVMVEGVANEQA